MRPAEWTNPEPRGRYNLVVIGGGTGGLRTTVLNQAILLAHATGVSPQRLARWYGRRPTER